jgi:hypothetical protein
MQIKGQETAAPGAGKAWEKLGRDQKIILPDIT